MKLRNEPIGKGKTIKPQHLNKIFIDCDTQKLLYDFENNNIQNDLLNSWEVIYYFNVLNSVITFSIDEYEFIHQSLKSFVRNKKIDEVLKKKLNRKVPSFGTSFF
jgi:hypothetical protein